MSRFAVTFSIDPGESSQTFQPLTPQKSAKTLMRRTSKLPKRVGIKRVPTALRERRNFIKIIEDQKKALAELENQIERKGSMRIRGIDLAKQLRSQGIGSASKKTSSPSKETDFGKEMKRQEIGLTTLRKAENEAMEKKRKKRKERHDRLSQKKRAMARDLAERLPETTEEREQRELDEHKIKLQKQKDVVDLWNTIIEYMDKKDRKLLDKTKFPMDLKKEITSDIKKTYKYTNEDEVILEPVEFNYFDKFHPENQGTFRTFSERRVTYKDKDLPPHVDPEPEVDFYFEFDKDNVDDIKSMCLRLRNHIATNRPIDFYWLYIEATPLVDGKKSGESKYESFYTFEAKPELFERILESREKRNEVLLRQSQSQSESGSKLPSESQSRTSGRKKKTKGKGNGKVNGRGKGSVKRKRSKRR